MDFFSALGNKNRLLIASYIRDNKEATFEQIRKEFNLNNNTLCFHITKLRKGNVIFQGKTGKPYKMTEIGELILNSVELLLPKIKEAMIAGKIK